MQVSIFAALLAGLISFHSTCVPRQTYNNPNWDKLQTVIGWEIVRHLSCVSRTYLA